MSIARLLVGPVTANWASQFLSLSDDHCRWFSPSMPDWAAVSASFPLGWQPDALLVRPGYASIPSWIWSAPVPVVAVAHDPNLLWHGYRELLPLFDLVLTDAPAVERLRRAGINHVREANLYGLDQVGLMELDMPEGERDIDILFVGNLKPAVQGDRLHWLGRLSQLADRYRVVIRTGVFGADYRSLIRRAKVVFNRSIRGECNQRAFEASTGGAVLLQEGDNGEIKTYLEPETEYVPYTETSFEDQIVAILADGERRRSIAERARSRLRNYGWLDLIRTGLANCADDWPGVLERTARRVANPLRPTLLARLWQRASWSVGPDVDTELLADLNSAGEDHALAVLAGSPGKAIEHLERVDANRVSLVGLGVALISLGRRNDAVVILRGVLESLSEQPTLTVVERSTCPYPLRFDYLSVGWERAAWDHPDDLTGEGLEKLRLLRCRAHSLLAELTGQLDEFQAAAELAPTLPTVQAAYGCALARAGRFAEAADCLSRAVRGNPFDQPAANALVGVLTQAKRSEDAVQVSTARRLLARAFTTLEATPQPIPTTVPPPPSPQKPPSAPGVVPLLSEEFVRRFGKPDTSKALRSHVSAADTQAILALITHLRPQRVLEIGTSGGHMTANLTAWTPGDAVIYSLGMADGASGSSMEADLPPRSEFARHVDHFGTARKAFLTMADSRTYDFGRLAPLDFVFINGKRDLASVRSDSLGAYAALRPGGCLVWNDSASTNPKVQVREAIQSLKFPEPLYQPAGTALAFLFRGEGVGALAHPDRPRISVMWEGEFEPAHSLAAVNRAVCAELTARGQIVGIRPGPDAIPVGSRVELPLSLAGLTNRSDRVDATVRHRWPPNFTPPADGAFVMIQPWEYGRLPRSWVEPIVENVDEIWAYSRSVERCYVTSGVPADRVVVIPPGVDPDRFRPGGKPLELATRKKIKLLFLGGTIRRKGIDALLTAYRRAFTAADDVCLVVKDFGAGTFYRGQTAGDQIATHQADPTAPEIEYRTEDMDEADLPRLYAACDALIQPYRGEGFGLPVLEAMACGLPVVVTAGGPTDEFVPPTAGWRIPARIAYLPQDAVGTIATVGRPWLLEPDADAMTAILRAVVGDAAERSRRGVAARRAALGWTWSRTAAAIEDRIRILRNRTPVRFARRTAVAVPSVPPPATSRQAPGVQEFDAVTPFVVMSDTPVLLPAMPLGRPRVSLTMIVKNEEHNIGACLEPVRSLVDEVIVVDTGSSDRTRAIAEGLGAKVSEFAWIDHFAAARNVALERATGDWAFWLDADDRVDAENVRKLATLFAGLRHENAAYVMTCLCVPDAPGGTATAVDHIRLFKQDPRHRWKYRVHEQILPALRSTGSSVRWSNVTVQHVGYVEPKLRKRKLGRDLRLLEIERTEQPTDPFTLFNLGCVYHELGDLPAAAIALEGSLSRSHPSDSIVRKLYAMLAQCHRKTGLAEKALSTVRAGRVHYPEDAELLFVESGLLKEAGDVRGTEELLIRLMRGREEGERFGSVDTGLRGHKARHNLACLYLETGRVADAESQWRAALADEPGFVPAHLGLGELYLRAKDWESMERVMSELGRLGPAGEASCEVLEGQKLTVQTDYDAAIAKLEAAAEKYPNSVQIRAALSVAWLQSGKDVVKAEAAVRTVLTMDPGNVQAKYNLEALLRNTGRL